MKTNLSITGLIWLITFSMSACQSSTPTHLAITQTPTTLPTPTAAPVNNEKEAIIQQINELVENYNTVIEAEKKTGNYEVITLTDGTEGFLFTGEALGKVYMEEERVQKEMAALNEEYYALVMKKSPATPTPNPLAQSGNPDKFLEEYLAWSEQESKQGSVVWVYATGDGSYYNILIGESYVALTQWEQELAIARAKLNNLPDKVIEADILEIQRVENSGGQVKFLDIGNFPFYSSDKKLSTYETQSSTYILYSQTHQIIEIEPKQLPPASEGLAKELEQKAREMIALISPEVNLDTLTPAHGAKIGTYFFHWDDSKGQLDNGGYPSIQVGLNGKGELLNYYNTLPLAR